MLQPRDSLKIASTVVSRYIAHESSSANGSMVQSKGLGSHARKDLAMHFIHGSRGKAEPTQQVQPVAKAAVYSTAFIRRRESLNTGPPCSK